MITHLQASMSTSIQPRGPAANPKYLPSTDPSNPYGFTDQLLKAGRLKPKVTDQCVFFFGYEGEDPHVALQQWFPAPLTAPRNPYATPPDNSMVQFPTTEHYMMYHKALLMKDEVVAARFLEPENAHPSNAKKLGRQVKNFDAKVWNENADRVVADGNLLKFSQNEDLKRMLLETGERIIVEASPDDKIWGIGFNSDDAEGREAEWGNNGLGKALMKVRAQLKDAEQ